jgi:hypothetical protein
MLARVFSYVVIGLEGVIVEVKADTGQGLLSIRLSSAWKISSDSNICG